MDQDFDLPSPGMLQVSVTEVIQGGADQGVPAKLQLVGFDPAPPLLNGSVGGTTGVFGDNVDRMPYGAPPRAVIRSLMIPSTV